MIDILPVYAGRTSVAGGAMLAALPPGAGVAFRVLCPATGSATLLLTLLASSRVTGFGADPIANGFASVVAGLGATLSLACAADPWFGGRAGRRLRLARGLPPVMVGASLSAVGCSDAGLATCSVAVCALLVSLGAGSASGSAASLAAWRLLRLQALAIAGCLLGLFFCSGGAGLDWNRPGVELPLASAGAAMMMLGFGALAGLAPFGGVAAEAAAQSAAPLAAIMVALLPLTSLALLLRARLLLVRAGLGEVADDALLASGLLSIAIAAALVWRGGDADKRDATVRAGVWGTVAFAFGLGGTSGVLAGLVALLAASFALPAQVLARRSASGRLGDASRLAVCVPPSGLFAGFVMTIGAALIRSPILLPPLLVLLCLLLVGLLRRSMPEAAPAATPLAIRLVLALHLAVAGIIGMAMPRVASDRMVDAAEFLDGGAP